MKAVEHFHERTDLCEDLIAGIVSDAPAFFGMITDFLPQGKIEVLELGSGTGFVTNMILEANPEARVTCIDMDHAMLAVARSKEALSGVSFPEGDFREVWPEGESDMIVTSLCLHHLPDDDRAAILGRVHESLRPGGMFINADVFRPDKRWQEDMLRQQWFRSMLANGLPADEAALMLAKREKNYEFLDTLSHFREKMRSAGFERTICTYVDGIYSVFVGWR